jgi:multiple sugar transport system substrate-binding protein
VVAAAGTTLAACAPAATPEEPTAAPSEEEAPAEAPPAGEKVTIRWQDWPDWEPQLEELYAMFEEDLPNLTIELEPLGDDFIDKTLTMMIAGEAPDVMTGWGPVFTTWAEKGQLMDLQPMVDTTYDADDIADFHQWQWDGMVHPESKIRFAMPYYVNIIMFLYDKGAFDEAGVEYPTADMDHDDYAAMIAKLNKEEDGRIVRWGGFVPMGWDRLHWHIQAFGGHVANPDDWTECWLDKPEAQEALEWIRARMWDDLTLMQPLQAEDRGEAGIWPTRLAATMEGGMGNLVSYATEATFEWDLTHVPKGPARRATLGTNDGWAIWKGTEHPDEAWEFMVYLCDKKFQTFVMSGWGTLPNRLSLLPDWKSQARAGIPELENVNLDVVLEALDEGYPLNSEQFKVQAESDTLIEAAIEKVFFVGDTPVSYFAEVAEQVTEVNRA